MKITLSLENKKGITYFRQQFQVFCADPVIRNATNPQLQMNFIHVLVYIYIYVLYYIDVHVPEAHICVLISMTPVPMPLSCDRLLCADSAANNGGSHCGGGANITDKLGCSPMLK